MMSVRSLLNECLLNASHREEARVPCYNVMRTEIRDLEVDPVAVFMAQRSEQPMQDAVQAIGSTPLIRLDRLREKYGIKCNLLAKAEFVSVGGSIKDRIAKSIIEEAEQQKRISPGDIVIEPTSGNTGIGLALVCAVKGYHMVAVMPEKMSSEKSDVLKALGAYVVRSPTAARWDGRESHISTAYALAAEINSRKCGHRAIVFDQYQHPGCIAAHYKGTAEEILKQTQGQLDAIAIATGTGGTLTGCATRIKEVLPHCKVLGVDVKGSIMHKPLGQFSDKDLLPYELEGMGHPFHPAVFHPERADKWRVIDDGTAFRTARELMRTEGLLCGGSGGCILAAALQEAATMAEGQTMVVLLPDGIRNYLTKFASDDWMTVCGYLPIEEHEVFAKGSKASVREKMAKVLDKFGDLPVVLDTDSVATAYEKVAETRGHVAVEDAQKQVVGIVAAEDLVQAIYNNRAQERKVVEMANPQTILAISEEASFATLQALMAAADMARKSRDPLVILMPGGTGDLDSLRARFNSLTPEERAPLKVLTRWQVASVILEN